MDRPQAKLTGERIAFALVAIVVFALDRITKNLVVAQIPYGTEVSVLGHVVGITNVHNAGAAFGLVPAGATFFLVAEVLVSIGLIVYVARTPGKLWSDAVIGLIVGGALGNAFDRVLFGTVTDFVNVHFWPVFNVADSAISIGVTVLIAGSLLRRTPHEA